MRPEVFISLASVICAKITQSLHRLLCAVRLARLITPCFILWRKTERICWPVQQVCFVANQLGGKPTGDWNIMEWGVDLEAKAEEVGQPLSSELAALSKQAEQEGEFSFQKVQGE